jgi:hypothetical protein
MRHFQGFIVLILTIEPVLASLAKKEKSWFIAGFPRINHISRFCEQSKHYLNSFSILHHPIPVFKFLFHRKQLISELGC